EVIIVDSLNGKDEHLFLHQFVQISIRKVCRHRSRVEYNGDFVYIARYLRCTCNQLAWIARRSGKTKIVRGGSMASEGRNSQGASCAFPRCDRSFTKSAS